MTRTLFIGWLVSALLGYCFAAAAIAQSVSLTTADEQSREGELQSLDSTAVTLVVSGKLETIPWDQLSRIVFPNESQTSPPSRVLLRDESSIAINAVELAAGGEQLRLDLRRQQPLGLPLASVSAIRFRPSAAATDAAWLGLLAQPGRSDRLIARREDDLETIEGPVLSISRDSISFSMAGNTIDAPLAKLEGTIFADVGSSAGDATVRVRDAIGSVWMVRSLSMPKGSETLEMTLGVGVQHSIPLDQVLEIEVQGGILTLVAAEVATSNLLPTLGLSQGSVPLDVWFGPKIEGEMVTMDGPGEISFRVPPGYSRIVGAVQHRSDVSQIGESTATLLLDDQSKWTMSMSKRSTFGFDLPLGDARRVTLRLDAGEDSSLGDAVQWIGTRLLK